MFNITNYQSVSSVSSVAQSFLTLCDPINCSTPDLPVHHQLPESTHTHVHPVSDAIQPSHPLSSPSPPAPNPSQHQGLFQWVNSSHELAKVLEFLLQHQSFQWTPRTANDGKSNLQWDTTSHLSKWLSSKKNTNNKCLPACGVKGTLLYFWWEWKLVEPSSMVVSLKAKNITTISSVHLLSPDQLFATPCTAAHQASLSITSSQSLLKLMSIESVMPSHLLPFPSPPAFNLSQHQGLFQWVSSSYQVYCTFSTAASASVLPMDIL